MKSIIKFLEKSIFYLWILLTIIVVYFIIERFLNPGYKGISIVDLKLYLKISIIVLVIIIILKTIKKKQIND